MDTNSGYVEVEHTADWALKVWAENLSGLLFEATRGMYELMGAVPGENQGVVRVRASGIDAESLLVNYLTELVLLGEEAGLMITPTAPVVTDFEISIDTQVYQTKRQEKEIKAVTYHQPG